MLCDDLEGWGMVPGGGDVHIHKAESLRWRAETNRRCKAIILQSEQINKYLLELKTMQQVMGAPIRAEGALNRVESKLLTIQREKLRTRDWHMTWGPKVL